MKLPQKLRFQEFMVAPTGAPSMAEAVRCGAEVYAALWELIVARFRSAGVGDEGGFALDITIPEQALDLLVEAIGQAGYRPGGEVQLALDPAANGFLSGDAYHLGDGLADTGDLIGRYQRLLATYPIRSIEDDLAVAAGVGQLKTGAPARGERVAKSNRLLAIEATSGFRYGLAY